MSIFHAPDRGYAPALVLLKGTSASARLVVDSAPRQPAKCVLEVLRRPAARRMGCSEVNLCSPRAQEALQSASDTRYAWLGPDAVVLKRSALAGAFDLGSRAREEALSAAVQTIVQASRSPRVRAIADAARPQMCPALNTLDVSGWPMTRDGPLLKALCAAVTRVGQHR